MRVEKNTIDTLMPPNDGQSFAIYDETGGSDDFAIGNTVANCQYGIVFCTYLNNLTTNLTTQAFFSGTAATGNTSVNNN